ncbi:MAG: thiolase domain-containing protein [Candidatus Thermoplasmatota archaeon]|nr:thiolase domain-containing protein [Candidatus Thermoplasmatota archaeon]MBU1940308.1 thiolase domain-containing protein [Candidatus Thermoplasmatota archaeon]
MRDVAVIGVGLTKFGEIWDRSFRQLIVEAGSKAILDAGIEGKDIDAMYVGSMSSGRFIGQEHVGALVADASGFYNLHIPSTRVEGACASGGLAVRQGYLSVASGVNDIVVIGGIEKMNDVAGTSATETLATAADQEWEAFFGATFPGLYAFIATRHMHEYGTTKEQLAQVAVKNHANGALNPYAQYQKEIKLEHAINATMVAYPLGLLDCSPVTDGSAAVVLCSAERAKEFTDTPVKIIGAGQASDSLALHGRRDITTLDATVHAAQMAYKQAKVTSKDIQLAEVHDCFTIAEICAIEDLGFVKKGDGGKAIDNNITTRDGSQPVNTSGGLKAKGHPVGATGVAQIIEIVLQLQGRAEKRQIPDARIGLAHNVGGSGATCTVHIMEGM